jgi:predicted nucleotidyltransferase
MIDTLISSKTRLKLLLKFFLNSNTTAYLRSLEEEFGESTNGIRVELNRFEDAGMLQSFSQGNKKIFKANTKHPLFTDIHSIIVKFVGLDKIIESIIERIGNIEYAYLRGSFARGIDGGEVDILLVGAVDMPFLEDLVQKAEKKINRKIVCEVVTFEQFTKSYTKQEKKEFLLLWEREK